MSALVGYQVGKSLTQGVHVLVTCCCTSLTMDRRKTTNKAAMRRKSQQQKHKFSRKLRMQNKDALDDNVYVR